MLGFLEESTFFNGFSKTWALEQAVKTPHMASKKMSILMLIFGLLAILIIKKQFFLLG